MNKKNRRLNEPRELGAQVRSIYIRTLRAFDYGN